ncbi:MAG: type I-F CRISPR-associated helicase Cas3 [SAR86 cluster bacterium]|uniref:Type I-F CRISPR-associated helicase Cas3 n=1 Tax=SAR86 cluster bacterium TaxID=2030880 RepID=A0A2A5C7S1_9GAMM|nr:MAG: type I-F CRISPR-associated helicase Cas3 [SAR86 cluster bacterium]
MMVTFVSQCEKKALNRSRRVLDAFANRIGDNTWQTVITNEGLLAVKKLLRKTASKNTAVSCFWIRSRSRSELVWVVGNRGKFNSEGVVPVNSTKRNLINSHIENDWEYLPLIKALVAIAALLHDWGKASQLFQEKLNPANKIGFKGDPIRHEWISCLLLNAHIQVHQKNTGVLSDSAWLEALMSGNIDETQIKVIATRQQMKPLADLPPIAKLIAWLIVSHHRLPLNESIAENIAPDYAPKIDDVLRRISQQWGYENNYDEAEYQQRVEQCFNFPNGLLSASQPWLKQIKKWSQRLLSCEKQALQSLYDGSYRSVLSYSRLCLMLGDHYYSSQDANKKWPDNTGLFANTDFKTKILKQKLDEHLVGVAKHGLNTAHLLPAFESEPPVAQDIVALKKLSPKGYRWQDKAVEKIKIWRADNTKKEGFFAVNMASTGCGKTFANAKIMQTLSDDGNSLRFVLALGLRTLTLQTGDEYRERVGLDETELAVLIGSRAVMELHQQAKLNEDEQSFEQSGSQSQETLLDEEVDYDCAIPEEGMATVLTCARDKKFLYAPVLACTIDHLMAATETKRGGRYILPTLRLMSSDVVIDEIDDFSGKDLVAIGRLIHLAGMLGRKVMISSATIPPDLAEGYFKAYRDGWQVYCKTRNASALIGCAWIDEFNTEVVSNSDLEDRDAILSYREQHAKFIEKRVIKLLKQVAKRKADIVSCEHIFSNFPENHNDEDVIDNKQQAYFKCIAESAINKHEYHHTVDTQSQLAVSFGVVRMANIQPCVALAQYLLVTDIPADTQIRVIPYHSQQVLLMRHKQEQHLDQVLKRKESEGEQPKAFSNPVIRQHLDHIKRVEPQVKNVLFILVATPVEEVGRDHDFDWAVVEPSSYRSIIQLAGRVRRHRKMEVLEPNISLLQYNWKGIKNRHRENAKVFNKPGFEEIVQLESHDLNDLLDTDSVSKRLDAIPRIKKPQVLQHTKQLADLEHYAIHALLATYRTSCTGPAQLQGYLREAWFLTAYPQTLAPFREGPPSLKIFLTFDEDMQECMFCEKNERGFPVPRELPLKISRVKLCHEAAKRLWLVRNFDIEIEALAEQQEVSVRRVSMRYGELSFPHSEKAKYEYNDQFGLVRV